MKNLPCAIVAGFTLLATTGCDSMKKMIDPTGNAYKDTTSKAQPAGATNSASPPAAGTTKPSSAPANATPAPPPPSPTPSSGKPNDAIIRTKAQGRFLTAAEVAKQIDEITFQARGRSFRFQKDLFRDKSGITSLRDSAGGFWGLAIGDINMDGSDDAALLLRTDRSGGSPTWDLAYLPNRNGRLFNVQTVALPGDQGYREAVIEGATVILIPAVDGPSVHVGYSGGELSIVAR